MHCTGDVRPSRDVGMLTMFSAYCVTTTTRSLLPAVSLLLGSPPPVSSGRGGHPHPLCATQKDIYVPGSPRLVGLVCQYVRMQLFSLGIKIKVVQNVIRTSDSHYVIMSIRQYVSMSICQYVSMSVCQYVNMSECDFSD